MVYKRLLNEDYMNLIHSSCNKDTRVFWYSLGDKPLTTKTRTKSSWSQWWIKYISQVNSAGQACWYVKHQKVSEHKRKQFIQVLREWWEREDSERWVIECMKWALPSLGNMVNWWWNSSHAACDSLPMSLPTCSELDPQYWFGWLCTIKSISRKL